MQASPTHKKRDAEATANRILSAAQQVFHERGYEGATTRQIADRAGINMALIKRYYGSKLGLFEKAVLPHLSLEHLMKVPIADLGDVLATTYANTDTKTGFDPFATMLRSISSPDAGPVLVDALKRQAIEPLFGILPGNDVAARVTLILTQLAGLILQFRILGIPPQSFEEREAIRARLAKHLNGLVTGDCEKSALPILPTDE